MCTRCVGSRTLAIKPLTFTPLCSPFSQVVRDLPRLIFVFLFFFFIPPFLFHHLVARTRRPRNRVRARPACTRTYVSTHRHVGGETSSLRLGTRITCFTCADWNSLRSSLEFSRNSRARTSTVPNGTGLISFPSFSTCIRILFTKASEFFYELVIFVFTFTLGKIIT